MCLLSLGIISLGGITSWGEKVTLLLDGTWQKIYLSPKHKVPTATAHVAEVCAGSDPASQG